MQRGGGIGLAQLVKHSVKELGFHFYHVLNIVKCKTWVIKLQNTYTIVADLPEF
jgi:hypothetical protein